MQNISIVHAVRWCNRGISKRFGNLTDAIVRLIFLSCWSVVKPSVMGMELLYKLRDWADMLLVAPLSANTLAKLANGLCDNLVVREDVTQQRCMFRCSCPVVSKAARCCFYSVQPDNVSGCEAHSSR